MIKKGEKYICINNVYMEGETHKPVYRIGKVYQSDVDGSLVDECNDTHYWSDRESFEKYFKKCTLLIKDSSNDRVNHPSHYTWLKKLCGIEVIDIIRHLDFNKGSAVKYILRSGYKEEEGYTAIQKEIEDIEKAIWCLKDEVNRLKNDKERV